MINWYLFSLFDKLGFKLKPSKLEKLPMSMRSGKNINPSSISYIQRRNIGIPLIQELWKKKRAKDNII